MILGLIAGKELKNDSQPMDKIKKFALIGTSLIAGGLLLHFLNICPIVKRIWTPSWTLFSGGLCFLFLSFFYWSIDILQSKNWYFILTVIGANSIAAYVMAHTIDSFIASSLLIHLGKSYAQVFGMSYSTLVSGFLILFFEWLILYWLYRKRVFIKV